MTSTDLYIQENLTFVVRNRIYATLQSNFQCGQVKRQNDDDPPGLLNGRSIYSVIKFNIVRKLTFTLRNANFAYVKDTVVDDQLYRLSHSKQ